MKRFPYILGLTLMLFAMPAIAQANCVAAYKAKQDNPLRLHYGEVQVSSCDLGIATTEVQAILSQRGWILLKIVSLKG